jgi:hypothetical protein
MLDRCSVMILKNETKGTRITQGCVEKNAMAANCGKNVTVEGVDAKVCCCDGNKCNDDGFTKQCQDNSISKSYIISADLICLVTALSMLSLLM